MSSVAWRLRTSEEISVGCRTATPGRLAGQECPAYIAKPAVTASPVLSGSFAEVAGEGFKCQLDLRRLEDGCRTSIECFSPSPLSFGRLSLPSAVEAFVRGCDLAIACPETPARPMQVDLLWRVSSVGVEPAWLALDLWVSVRTQQPDSWPELAVKSSASADEAFWLRDPAAGDWALCGPPAPAAALTPADGAGCVLLRSAGGALSYVEMIHPADFERLELAPPAAGGVSSISHRLFAQRLEKGVILRGRIRGALVARGDDLQLAAACYRQFADEEPYLGP